LKIKIRSPFAIAVAGTLALGLTGCFGGSSSSSDASNSPSKDSESGAVMTPTSELQGKQTGSFRDVAVEGLTYWTASNGLGQTGEKGSFNFEPGEVVALYLGNELITLTDAELVSTPFDTLSVRNVTQKGSRVAHQVFWRSRMLQSTSRY
jgi:hypothetical protein